MQVSNQLGRRQGSRLWIGTLRVKTNSGTSSNFSERILVNTATGMEERRSQRIASLVRCLLVGIAAPSEVSPVRCHRLGNHLPLPIANRGRDSARNDRPSRRAERATYIYY